VEVGGATMKRRRYILVGLALAVALGFATTAVLAQSEPGPAAGRAYAVGDPANRLAGEVNADAVRAAQQYDRAPVLWLGEEFQGLRLARAQAVSYTLTAEMTGRDEDIDAESLYLIYGDCVPADSGDGPSCVPPLQVIVRTANAIPGAHSIERRDGFSSPYQQRGVTAMNLQTATTLWLPGGSSVTVHADPDLREAAVAALRTANHEALGIGEVAGGRDLSRLVLGRP